MLGAPLHVCRFVLTWRSIEEHTPTWAHAELLELLWVINWVQDHLLQIPLNLLQTAYNEMGKHHKRTIGMSVRTHTPL